MDTLFLRQGKTKKNQTNNSKEQNMDQSADLR